MKAIITLHPTKCILDSCPVNKIPFDQVPVNFATGYSFLPGINDPNGHQKSISLSCGCILQLVILSTMFPTGHFPVHCR